jgi:hypothetical protein
VRTDSNNFVGVVFNVGQLALTNVHLSAHVYTDVPKSFPGNFYGYFGKYHRDTGSYQFFTRYGTINRDTRITGLTYFPFEDTWVLCGYGDNVTPEFLNKMWVMKADNTFGTVIDVYIFNTLSPPAIINVQAFDVIHKTLNNSHFFYVGFTLGDQLLGNTYMDSGVLKLNRSI